MTATTSDRRRNWRRVVAGGALWALVYNILWGIAWFAFMRSEWEQAAAASHRPMPWTAEVWFLWAVLTAPLGVTITAYAAGRKPLLYRAAVSSSAAMWLLLTVAMGAYSLSQSLSPRVIALDSLVNVVAVLAAALASAWSQRDA